MSNAIFPALAGIGWPVKKTPQFNSKVQSAISFAEVRAAFAPYPQWRWALTYNFLRADTTNLEYQTLVNFFLTRQGKFDSFLFDDQSDNAVTDQLFGVGNGSSVAFQLSRTFAANGFAEFIYNLNGAPVIKDNGVTRTAGVDYNIVNGLVTFTTPPANSHSLTWTGGYYWRARFDVDAAEFTQFVNQFWSGSITLVSIIGS